MATQNWLQRFSRIAFGRRPASRRRKTSRKLAAPEQLETRALMAQMVGFHDGTLDIHLSNNGQQGETVVVGNENGRVVDLSGNSPLNEQVNVRADQVREIRVFGSSKGDTINLSHVNQGTFPNLQHTRLEGRQGRDTIVGSEVNDSILGHRGNDNIEGRGGNDYIRGGRGDDHIQGGFGSDTIFGDAGNDWLYGLTHASNNDGRRDAINGGRGGRDHAYGERHDRVYHAKRVRQPRAHAAIHCPQRLIGADGEAADQAQRVKFHNGILDVYLKQNGRKGQTVFIGNERGRVVDISGNSPLNDQLNIRADQVREIRIFGTNRGDTINLSLVTRETFTAMRSTRVEGRSGRDFIVGSQFNDYLYGNGGNDTIEGRAGNDVIKGGRGDDTLSGWDGWDAIYGGRGNDTLYGVHHASSRDNASDYLNGGPGQRDRIFGNKRDRILDS